MPFELMSASPHCLKYTVTGEATENRTRAELIADCVPGPLRDLFQDTTDEQDWQNLARGPLLSIYSTPEGGTFVVSSFGGEPPNLFMSVALTESLNPTTLEIRYHHSIVR